MMVALPELDGGMMSDDVRRPFRPSRLRRALRRMRRRGVPAGHGVPSRSVRRPLAGRVAALVALRRATRRERRVAVVLFNFPPNAGCRGDGGLPRPCSPRCTTRCCAMQDGGLHGGGAGDRGGAARRASWSAMPSGTAPIPTWPPGSAPEHHVLTASPGWRRSSKAGVPHRVGCRSDGASLFVLGERFGNVFVGLQPAFGYEGDPMRLLFEQRLRAHPCLRRPFTAGSSRISVPMRCCISAPTARWSSCRASSPGCQPNAGRTG